MIEIIQDITSRSDKNKNIKITMHETHYVDIHDSGNKLGCLRESTLITGDCLELRRKIEGILYCFNVYTKQGENYVVDINQTLYVGIAFSSPDSLYYSVEVTEQEYQSLLWQKKVLKRNRIIEYTLS